jgi:hypothetical protein
MPSDKRNAAGDTRLALTNAARAEHQDSAASSLASRAAGHGLYPFRPPGEAEVNLSNAGKILQEYCTEVMQQQIAPRSLCRFRREAAHNSPQPEPRETLEGVRYPSPEGWREVVKDEGNADVHALFLACGAEVVRHPRYANKTHRAKDVMCFFYVVVVQLRKHGLLDANNKPTAHATTYSRVQCEAIATESTWSLRPRFRGVQRGNAGHVEKERTGEEELDEGEGLGDADSDAWEEDELCFFGEDEEFEFSSEEDVEETPAVAVQEGGLCPCGTALVDTVCTNKYKCKLGTCSNKNPCKQRGKRCPQCG